MKKGSILISIPQPCTQRFEDMEPDAKGRFCGSCQKTVIDFTAMTDSQLLSFFKNNTGDVCGKVADDQLERAIAPVYVKKNTFNSISAAAAMIIALLAIKPSLATAQRKAPIVLHRSFIKTEKLKYFPDNPVLKGIVLDDNSRSVPFAMLMLKQKGLTQIIYTDSNGRFSFVAADKLQPGATLTATCYTKSATINLGPARINDQSDIIINIANAPAQNKVLTQPLSCRVGGVMLTSLTVQNSYAGNPAYGMPSVWDWIRDLLP